MKLTEVADPLPGSLTGRSVRPQDTICNISVKTLA